MNRLPGSLDYDSISDVALYSGIVGTHFYDTCRYDKATLMPQYCHEAQSYFTATTLHYNYLVNTRHALLFAKASPYTWCINWGLIPKLLQYKVSVSTLRREIFFWNFSANTDTSDISFAGRKFGHTLVYASTVTDLDCRCPMFDHLAIRPAVGFKFFKNLRAGDTTVLSQIIADSVTGYQVGTTVDDPTALLFAEGSSI